MYCMRFFGFLKQIIKNILKIKYKKYKGDNLYFFLKLCRKKYANQNTPSFMFINLIWPKFEFINSKFLIIETCVVTQTTKNYVLN